MGKQTGDSRYVESGERTLAKWDEWTLAAAEEEGFSCGYTVIKQFASHKKEVHELSEPVHAHTFHMTLLGIAALYNATGKAKYWDVVSKSVNRLMDEWILLAGAMTSDERYLPRGFYNPRSEVEVCPQYTWILLLAQALEWTGEARYAAEIERDLFNHLLAAQLDDGSNWSYMTPPNGHAQEPYGPNCCNASGHRIAARMPTYLWGLRGNAPAILLYSESEGTLRPEGLPTVTLRQETRFPSDGEVMIYIDPEQPYQFPLHLRIPPYVKKAMVGVNDNVAVSAAAGDFHVVERLWSPGDSVQLHLPMEVGCQAGEDSIAVIRGPLVYAYFHGAQPAPLVFHGRRGRFADDVSLNLDPTHLHQLVQVGPALRIQGTVRAQRPMFASASANAGTQGRQEVPVRLLPFVNQGSIRGEYRVFIDLHK